MADEEQSAPKRAKAVADRDPNREESERGGSVGIVLEAWTEWRGGVIVEPRRFAPPGDSDTGGNESPVESQTYVEFSDDLVTRLTADPPLFVRF